MFYDRYVALCVQKGVSPSAAAENIGLNRASVVKWKKGATPSGETISKFATYFDVSADYLLEKEAQAHKAPASAEAYVNGDPELNDYLEALKNREECRMLFSLAKGATKEDVMRAVAIIEALRSEEEGR